MCNNRKILCMLVANAARFACRPFTKVGYACEPRKGSGNVPIHRMLHRFLRYYLGHTVLIFVFAPETLQKSVKAQKIRNAYKLVCTVPNVAVDRYVMCPGAWVIRKVLWIVTPHMAGISATAEPPPSQLSKQSTCMRHLSKRKHAETSVCLNAVWSSIIARRIDA